MKTIASTNYFSKRTVQVSPQLHLEITFIRPIEPRHAIFALKQEEVTLAYDEKYCSFNLVTFHHADTPDITSLSAFVNLDQACFHQGQFFAGKACSLVLEGNVLARATIVEVKHPALSYWDWKQVPAFLKNPEAHFNAEKAECFLLNLEFELLDLGFTRDYTILKPKTGDYALEVRLYSSVEALDENQARQILNALYSLPYQHCQLKPGFYQLDAGGHLENFECSFIIGDGSQYITGRFIVI
jgi:hypothetical protein